MDNCEGIFFDVEMRTEDQDPALIGVLVDEEFTITCLEEGLRPAAEHAGLEVVNPHEFFTSLLLKAEEEDRALVAYTFHEFEVLEKMFHENSEENKHLLDILNRRYVNANARKILCRALEDLERATRLVGVGVPCTAQEAELAQRCGDIHVEAHERGEGIGVHFLLARRASERERGACGVLDGMRAERGVYLWGGFL